MPFFTFIHPLPIMQQSNIHRAYIKVNNIHFHTFNIFDSFVITDVFLHRDRDDVISSLRKYFTKFINRPVTGRSLILLKVSTYVTSSLHPVCLYLLGLKVNRWSSSCYLLRHGIGICGTRGRYECISRCSVLVSGFVCIGGSELSGIR